MFRRSHRSSNPPWTECDGTTLAGSPRILYWWTLPVRPGTSASLGRRLLMSLVVWAIAGTALVLVLGEFVVKTN